MEIAHVASWKLFLLLPRLLLLKTARGGEAGSRDLKRRVALFDGGQLAQLLAEGRRVGMKGRAPVTHTESSQLAKAIELVSKGELSHAARELKSKGLAPGTDRALAELTDPELRPVLPAEPIPETARQYQPPGKLAMGKKVFSETLRQSRRGKSVGLTGI